MTSTRHEQEVGDIKKEHQILPLFCMLKGETKIERKKEAGAHKNNLSIYFFTATSLSVAVSQPIILVVCVCNNNRVFIECYLFVICLFVFF